MRKQLFLSLIAGTALLVGSAAQAGPLDKATWAGGIQGTDVTVTNSGATCTDNGFHTVKAQTQITCPTAGLGATGSATATDYSVSLTVPLFELKQFTTGGAIDIYTHAKLSGMGGATGNNSAATAMTGVKGYVQVNVAGHTLMGVNASMFFKAKTTLVNVPLSVGRKDQFTGFFTVLQKPHYITVDFYAWSPHTVTISGLTSKYAPLTKASNPMANTVVAMGSFGLTANGGGTVVLVAPAKVSIDGTLAQRRTAQFTSLTLTYAPEPGTLLLIGAGVAGLLLVGSRKRS